MHWPAVIEELVPLRAYRLETRPVELSNGLFPGLLLDRIFLKQHTVDGLRFLEFQRANGTRHIVEAGEIERALPIGRLAAMRDDALRTNLALRIER
ncbi:hypothetical protein NK8_85900 (plasmid) [Caballeronia sp. NK8]|nr:hypothetical protein NK8_85900 [Caballeronia sp. NK8]